MYRMLICNIPVEVRDKLKLIAFYSEQSIDELMYDLLDTYVSVFENTKFKLDLNYNEYGELIVKE